ncbi:MAG: bifunctional phosphoribosylaminoimidazolecarboxamide formyltransferase/IMP cyclohydrolase [Coriobacteriia bacterium]|nr:bifunctional phosphoribosylaminoimidazolecarboxamide formyltransferase/IMP cyclohydrolase [Coriobacteriia bacterium]
MDRVRIQRAIVSVSDKTGVVDFARELQAMGVQLVSTGGTAAALSEAGIAVIPVEQVTGFPEMMEGRVKTLHPKVHGGLLADRSKPEHLAQAERNGIGLIDMVVVNLYPFEATVSKPGVALEDAIENIDIGGPSMLRSAAKNFAAVTVVADPADYDSVLAEMRANGGTTGFETRRRLAVEAFKRTSAYDDAIFRHLSPREPFPEELRLRLLRVQGLRYGENPHQEAAFYRDAEAAEHTLARAEQLHGKELSYNNILDADGAWAAVAEFDAPACVIVKHTNPCGVSVAEDLLTAYRYAHESDPVSAFGGVMAFNRSLTRDVVEAIDDNGQFVEVIVAPEYAPDALRSLSEKKNLRLLRTGGVLPLTRRGHDMRKVEGGMLVQTFDVAAEDPSAFKVVSKRQPTGDEWTQLLFAWKVAKSVKSNAILLARGTATVGVGAGQMSRVDAARIAVEKAGERAHGCVCGSDAFMPFPDSLEVVGEAGCSAVIQPGGSMRDQEVIDAADALGMALVFTGYRHFRH